MRAVDNVRLFLARILRSISRRRILRTDYAYDYAEKIERRLLMEPSIILNSDGEVSSNKIFNLLYGLLNENDTFRYREAKSLKSTIEYDLELGDDLALTEVKLFELLVF